MTDLNSHLAAAAHLAAHILIAALVVLVLGLLVTCYGARGRK